MVYSPITSSHNLAFYQTKTLLFKKKKMMCCLNVAHSTKHERPHRYSSHLSSMYSIKTHLSFNASKWYTTPDKKENSPKNARCETEENDILSRDKGFDVNSQK